MALTGLAVDEGPHNMEGLLTPENIPPGCPSMGEGRRVARCERFADSV